MEIDDKSIITLDTNCFIYYFEDNAKYAPKLESIFNKIQDGSIQGSMSVLSFLEILVKPKKENNVFLENRYKVILSNYPNLRIIELSLSVADLAAKLRALYNLKTPDAIILATSLYINSKYLITNDLHFKHIGDKENISVILLDEL
jgi:predicted nucleic acid-binding protein